MSSDKYVKTIGLSANAISAKWPSSKSLGQQLDYVSDSSATLLKLCPGYDFGKVEANGYRSTLYAIFKLTEAASEAKDAQECSAYVSMACFVLRWVLFTNPNGNGLVPLAGDDLAKFYHEYRGQAEQLAVVMNKFPSRLYNGICGQLGDIPAKVAALLKAPTTWSMVKFAFSSSHRKHLLIDALINGDLSYFSFYYNICENRIYHKMLSTANQRLFPEVEVGELCPEVESKYVLKLNGSHVDLELGCQPKPYKIRIKTYKSRDCKNPRKLLFQIHGGGFCGFSVDSHEMYLVPYVQRLADVVIVSVDYTLVPKAYFPQQVQECLDVYTWATSPSCPLFEQGLDSVIVTGDSAGGNFAIALVNVLGDIRAQFPEGCPKMPKALVPVYPAASLSGAFHPSLVLASLDAMIGPASLGMIMHDYALPGYGFTMSKFAAQKYDEKVYQLLQHPYVSPLHGDFEKLSDVKLSLISAEGCCLLDQSVDLAGRWRGQVTLDVIERAPHGFLNFVNICDQAKDGLGRVVRRFKEGFQHTT